MNKNTDCWLTLLNSPGAVEHGLVSKVVKPEELQDEVNRIAQKIIEKSRSVIALGKSAFYRQIVKDRNSAYQYVMCRGIFHFNIDLKKSKKSQGMSKRCLIFLEVLQTTNNQDA